ncbi:hypothetical protein [Pseudarthrobacter sp. NamB4]|uniref:hypothetical protein n=1 Tax=Pseudarthrobacter sp. NamB4 TaxID=2576837 RepID=UPI0010FD3722|nr:hypothetical protein [Pseudarthrobacter sp. NamB4]TLM73091.1 hypothetical protein FDW81_10435 [Pseudarthrobacter sp. NamB4]
MLGAPRRVQASLAVLAALLTGCSPVVGLDQAATGPAAISQMSPASSAPDASGDATSVTATVRTQIPTPAPTLTATPVPSPPPAPAPPPVPQPFALNLYQEGDFVPQYTFDWCVAASIQMAHNLIDDTGGATWADPTQQSELWEMARARSSNSFNGANPLGWAQVLTEAGMGPYRVVSIPDYGDALRTAARAISETGGPVGLVMWRGRHAWVMSGFESVGNPAQFPEFSVTGVRVLDPLYPHGSGQWGPSPAPNSLLTPEELATQFVVREPRRWSSDLPAGYLLVLPVAGA